MDPLTHLTLPAAATLAGRRDFRTALLAALGGLLPDVEKGFQLLFAWLPGGYDTFFKHGGTHTVPGAALLCVTAALFLSRDRLRGFTYLLLGAWMHVGLDLLQSPWAVRPFLPFSCVAVEHTGWSWVLPLQAGLVCVAALVIYREAAPRLSR